MSCAVRALSQAGLAARQGDLGTIDEGRRTYSFSPIMASSSRARRLPKSPIGSSAYARRFPRPRVRRLGPTSKARVDRRRRTEYRLPQDSAAHAVALDPKSLGDRKPRVSLSRPRGLSRAGPRHGDDSGGRLEAPGRIRRRPMLALPGLGVAASSFSDEERGRDGAMSCGCCGSHPRRGATTVLTAAEERELMNWEAETYRQSIAASNGKSLDKS